MAWTGPDIPYNDLPDLPPKIDLETTGIFKAAIKAHQSLAELKGFCQTLPEPEIILNTVILQESKDSSAIENIVTTQDELYRAALVILEDLPSATKEVLRYREAIYAGLRQFEKTGLLTLRSVIDIMQTIKNSSQQLRRMPGTKLANPVTGNVLYTPPAPEYIDAKMRAWEAFANSDTLTDPLIKMALLHYQFEAIHPFADGNGRTGRIINVLYLIKENLLSLPILYLSDYIIRNKNQYYSLLQSTTQNETWEEWVLFMLRGVDETARNTLTLISKIGELERRTLEEMRQLSGRLPVHDLNKLIFSFPYIKIKILIDRGIAKRQTASVYLQYLAELGILEPQKVGRDIYYINKRLVQLLAGVNN